MEKNKNEKKERSPKNTEKKDSSGIWEKVFLFLAILAVVLTIVGLFNGGKSIYQNVKIYGFYKEVCENNPLCECGFLSCHFKVHYLLSDGKPEDLIKICDLARELNDSQLLEKLCVT